LAIAARREATTILQPLSLESAQYKECPYVWGEFLRLLRQSGQLELHKSASTKILNRAKALFDSPADLDSNCHYLPGLMGALHYSVRTEFATLALARLAKQESDNARSVAQSIQGTLDWNAQLTSRLAEAQLSLKQQQGNTDILKNVIELSLQLDDLETATESKEKLLAQNSHLEASTAELLARLALAKGDYCQYLHYYKIAVALGFDNSK